MSSSNNSIKDTTTDVSTVTSKETGVAETVVCSGTTTISETNIGKQNYEDTQTSIDSDKETNLLSSTSTIQSKKGATSSNKNESANINNNDIEKIIDTFGDSDDNIDEDTSVDSGDNGYCLFSRHSSDDSDSNNERTDKSKDEDEKKRKHKRNKKRSYESVYGVYGRQLNHDQTHLLEAYKTIAMESLKYEYKVHAKKQLISPSFSDIINVDDEDMNQSIKLESNVTTEQQQRQQRQSEKEKDEDRARFSSEGWSQNDLIPPEKINSLFGQNETLEELSPPSLSKFEKFDYIPEDYGINFWEEGQNPINDERIIKRMHVTEIEALIGAVNGTTDKNLELDLDGNNRIKDDSLMNIESNKKCNTNTINNATKSYMETRLWHMPYVPPKKTHLEFLLQCAGIKLSQSEMQAKTSASQHESLYQWKGKLEDEEDEHSKDNEKNSQQKEQEYYFDSDDSDDSMYAPFRDFKLHKQIEEWNEEKENKKYVESSKSMVIEILSKKWKGFKNLHGAFDETALVTIGLLVEESMIATLLPLAKHHVARCRALEISKQEHEKSRFDSNYSVPLNTIHDPFVQWTLPPAEAIANLCHPVEAKQKKWSDEDIFLPSSSITCMDNHMDDASNDRIQNWPFLHGISTDHIIENMDLFKLLICDPRQYLTGEYMCDTQNVEKDAKRVLINTSVPDDHYLEEIDWPIPKILRSNVDDLSVSDSGKSSDVMSL